MNIPLTAFAVAGGALAIGIGFGSQTVISNFISGLLLLAERPIRTGDLVEVGGVVGCGEPVEHLLAVGDQRRVDPGQLEQPEHDGLVDRVVLHHEDDALTRRRRGILGFPARPRILLRRHRQQHPHRRHHRQRHPRVGSLRHRRPRRQRRARGRDDSGPGLCGPSVRRLLTAAGRRPGAAARRAAAGRPTPASSTTTTCPRRTTCPPQPNSPVWPGEIPGPSPVAAAAASRHCHPPGRGSARRWRSSSADARAVLPRGDGFRPGPA